MNLSKKIKLLRIWNDLNSMEAFYTDLNSVSSRTGITISLSKIKKVEAGEGEFSEKEAVTIALYFNIPVEALMNDAHELFSLNEAKINKSDYNELRTTLLISNELILLQFKELSKKIDGLIELRK
jgi:hypothetical protein